MDDSGCCRVVSWRHGAELVIVFHSVALGDLFGNVGYETLRRHGSGLVENRISKSKCRGMSKPQRYEVTLSSAGRMNQSESQGTFT